MKQWQRVVSAHRYLRGMLICYSSLAVSPLWAASDLASPSSPLVSAVSPAGWSAGVTLSFEDRELKHNDTLVEMEGTRAVAEVGVELLPFVQLAGEVGWFSADLDTADGENGLAWGVSARANLGELVLDSSPEIGRKRWLGVGVNLAYRSSESNLPDQDSSYDEWEILPHVVYRENRRGDARLKAYRADGFGLRAGLIFSSVEGDLGTRSLTENRNFGGSLGLDVRWRDGWVGTVQANLYGTNDTALRLGVVYHF